MPVINRLGSLDWFNQPAFTFTKGPGAPERQPGTERDDLLGLTVKVTLNSPLPHTQVPYFQVEEDDSYTWECFKGLHVDLDRYSHPVYALITELMEYSGEKVLVEMPKSDQRAIILTFYSKEEIVRPTNYLLALATKMAKWATPKQAVLLDGYAREKVERTIADLDLALATARNFLGMVAYCEAQGIEPTAEVREIIAEMEKLRHPNAPAGPHNDIWKVCGLFQRGQTAIHASATPQQQAEMISGCKKKWKED